MSNKSRIILLSLAAVLVLVWGLDMGGIRLPNVSLSDEAKADCVKRLKKIGYK